MRPLALASFLLLLVCSPTAQNNPPTDKKPEQYSATAFPSGIAGPNSVQNTLALDIYINSYTPDEELQNLVNVSGTQGLAGVEKAFSKLKDRGRVSVTFRSTQGGFRFIRSSTSGTETVIRMATDRVLSFQERTGDTSLGRYRFSLIELHLDAQGRGQGTITYAAKLKFNSQGDWDVESYSATPIPLTNVRKLN